VRGFVCVVGPHVVTSPWEQYHERLEYRRADGSDRPHVFTLRRLCKAHMEEAVAARKGKPAGEQGDLGL
jgi:hypothetical protein